VTDNRESHQKVLDDVAVEDSRGGRKDRPRHPLSTKDVVDAKAGFGGEIKNAAMRNGKTWHTEFEHPVPSTTRGVVLTDWPYNRGSTPPAFHPLPLYKPVDTRDENGAMKEPDGRVFSRNYFAAHSRSMVTSGGYLNGLPRAGESYRPHRVCGKGVLADTQAQIEAKELDALSANTDGDPQAHLHLELLRKNKVKTVPIEDQIAGRVVNLHAGGSWGQPVEFIPIQLTTGPDLLELDLSSNKLRRLPDAICNMPNLVRMVLDSNFLEGLPQGLGALKSLTWLSCCNNLIDRVPLSFANMPVIQRVDFSNNKVPLLYAHTTCSSTMTALSFSGNKCCSQMPAHPGAEPEEVLKMDSVHQMISLTSLNLEFNRLTHVPFGLSALGSLKFLRLGRNQIVSRGAGGTSHPELDAADAMKQLHRLAPCLLLLELHQNRIEDIPKELCLLSQLTHLDFSMNHISTIPNEVTSLAALRTFKIDRCPLSSIPTSMASMSWLREFTSKDCVLGRVGGVIDSVPGGTVGTWRRQHGPLDRSIFQQLGQYLQLDPMVVARYEKAKVGRPFDSHAGVHAAPAVAPPLFSSAKMKPETAGSAPRTPASRRSSRHGARSAMTMLIEEIDEASTEAQRARGRQELNEAKLRYTARKNEKYNKEDGERGSPGGLIRTSKETLSSPIRTAEEMLRSSKGRADLTSTVGNLSSVGSRMQTRHGSTSRESRPHPRTYLFEHQLENSIHALEDGWNDKVGIPVPAVAVGRAASNASAASSDSDLQRKTSHASSEDAPAKPQWVLEEEERAWFNAQMGIRDPTPPPPKAYESYLNAASTPYVPIERLQGL
jgi:Leucine-rich repeat (LRR) protein